MTTCSCGSSPTHRSGYHSAPRHRKTRNRFPVLDGGKTMKSAIGFAFLCFSLWPPLTLAKDIERIRNSNVLVTEFVLAPDETEKVAAGHPGVSVYWKPATFEVTRTNGKKERSALARVSRCSRAPERVRSRTPDRPNYTTHVLNSSALAVRRYGAPRDSRRSTKCSLRIVMRGCTTFRSLPIQLSRSIRITIAS
jgi:hypothetical protein